MSTAADKLTVNLDDIKLGPTDCALVLKENGTLEVLTPLGVDKDGMNYKLLESCIAHIQRMVDENNLPDFKNKVLH